MCPELNLVLFCYFHVLLTQVVVLSVFGRAVQIYNYVTAHNCSLSECLDFTQSGHQKERRNPMHSSAVFHCCVLSVANSSGKDLAIANQNLFYCLLCLIAEWRKISRATLIL